MEFILITSKASKACTTLENHKLIKLLPNMKRINVNDLHTTSILRLNGIERIPVLIVHHSDNEINRIIGTSNILKFIENWMKSSVKHETFFEGLRYTTKLPDDLERYDLVIIGEKIVKYPSDENVIKLKITQEGLKQLADKMVSLNVKDILVVSTKKEPILKIVGALYLSLIDNKDQDEVEEILESKLNDIHPELVKIIDMNLS